MIGLYENICKSSAHKGSRDQISGYVLKNPESFLELLRIATDISDVYHYKACWILELVVERKTEWLQPHLAEFCETLIDYKHDGAIRSVSKICLFAVKYHMKEISSGKNFLLEDQLQLISEACFNWLIGAEKVACKAYSIRALFEIGKLQGWIYPELKGILLKDFAVNSAAYKAVAKQILPKLK